MSACIEYRLAERNGEASSDRFLPIGEKQRPNVLVYRNDLIERSETFVVSQASAMRRFRAVFCGLTRCTGGILPKHAPSAILGADGGIHSFLQRRAFMYTGWGPAWQRHCSEFRPVLMHAHFALDAAFALPLCYTLRIPLVVSLHGYDITHSDRAMHATSGGRLFLRRREELFAQADLFLCISHFIREKALERGYPKEKLWVHSVGIDLDSFSPGEGNERNEVVLFVGRLVEKKGCVHLIRAMQSVQKRRPLAQLVVIGDGPLRSQLQDLAEFTLPGRYMFLGAQPANVVRSWLRRAMVFSVPSITAADGNAEGLGMVFCEAQAMGVPVVSFASGGIPEAVLDGATGYLLPEHDEKSLAQKICTLLENRTLWAEMSILGQKWMAAKFNLKVQTEMLESKYDEVLAAAS
jgi:colanic acid/amylovoran biosynthesis glycosyltransferase